MKTKKIMTLILEDGEPKISEIKNSLKTFQDLVGGRIDIATRKVIDKYFDFILNDEGAVNGMKPTLLFTKDDKVVEVFFGNLILCKANSEGETIGLTKEEVSYLICNIGVAQTMDGENIFRIKI